MLPPAPVGAAGTPLLPRTNGTVKAGQVIYRGLTASDVVGRLRGLGQSRPAGRLRDGGRVRTLVVREPVDSLDALRGLDPDSLSPRQALDALYRLRELDGALR